MVVWCSRFDLLDVEISWRNLQELFVFSMMWHLNFSPSSEKINTNFWKDPTQVFIEVSHSWIPHGNFPQQTFALTELDPCPGLRALALVWADHTGGAADFRHLPDGGEPWGRRRWPPAVEEGKSCMRVDIKYRKMLVLPHHAFRFMLYNWKL